MKSKFLSLVLIFTTGMIFAVEPKTSNKKDIEKYRIDLKFGTPKVRAYAAFKLGLLHDKDSVKLLISALSDRAYQVRADAASALGELGDQSAITALTGLLKDENPQVRIAAAKSLKRLNTTPAFPTLLELLKDEISEIRLYAAEVLGEYGDKTAIDALIYVAEQDEDSRVRIKAKEAIEYIKKRK